MARVQVASSLLALALVAGPAAAQTSRPPPTVAAKIAVLDAACRSAGGQPAGGAYIFVYDFTGDGVNDYLVSEGNYACAGKPELFRPGGKAAVEIYVSNAGDAQRVFGEVVRGYRIVDGRPRTVQVMREGAICGGGASTCTVTLLYDGPTHRFTTGSGVAAPAQAPPLAAVAPSPGPGVRLPAAPPAAPLTTASGAPETQPAFLARCRAERMARYRGLSVAIADSSCKEIWTKAQAAMPAANAILAIGGGAPGPMTQAAVRAPFAGAAWSGPVGRGISSSTRLGQWRVELHGQALVEQVLFDWGKTGDTTPFDIVEALKMRGARVSEVACLGFGASEQTHVYRVDAAGRPPFGLTVYDRGAATASSSASYMVTADLKGPAPTLASVKRMPDGADYQARCED